MPCLVPCPPAGRRASADSEGPTPWFQAYRREYLRMQQFGEHETLDHPVACEGARAWCGLPIVCSPNSSSAG